MDCYTFLKWVGRGVGGEASQNNIEQKVYKILIFISKVIKVFEILIKVGRI